MGSFGAEPCIPLMRSRLLTISLLIIGVAACGRRTTVADENLRRDLDLARGPGLELAPRSGSQTTVSAEELLPAGSRLKTNATPARRAQKPASPHVARNVASTAPVSSRRDSVVASAPATPRPSAQGAISPPPPGGYKTMGELIRKAPFPINP